MGRKKILAVMLTAAMTFSLLTGCGGGSKEETTDASKANTEKAEVTTAAESKEEALTLDNYTLPLSTSKEELTMWMVYNGKAVKDPNEIAGVKKMEEDTGVHINFITVNQSELSEKLGILLASGDYPDIIYSGSFGYPGGVEKGIEDGVVIDMDSYIRNYMPHYMAILNSNEEARREATADDGKLHQLKLIVGTDANAESEGTYQGLVYRKDLLDKMGLDVPVTIDDWHTVLTSCKAAGMKAPMTIGTDGSSELSLAWGVYTGAQTNYLQLEGNKLEYAPAMEGYGKYLDNMRQWYAEGLIDPNFTSNGICLQRFDFSSFNTDDTMLTTIISGFTGNMLVKSHFITNDKVFLQPIVSPVLNENDAPIQYGRRIIAKDYIYITTSCKNPELAAKWLDYQYSKEGYYTNWYGVEGVTYQLGGDDNTPQYTDYVLKNKDGMAPKDVLELNALNAQSWFGYDDITQSFKLNTALSGDNTNQQQIATDLWSEPAKNVFLTESIALTEEEGNKANNLTTALNTMVQEHMVNYILGQDNTTQEEFTKKLYDYGLQEVLDIYQAAYDRYLAR